MTQAKPAGSCRSIGTLGASLKGRPGSSGAAGATPWPWPPGQAGRAGLPAEAPQQLQASRCLGLTGPARATPPGAQPSVLDRVAPLLPQHWISLFQPDPFSVGNMRLTCPHTVSPMKSRGGPEGSRCHRIAMQCHHALVLHQAPRYFRKLPGCIQPAFRSRQAGRQCQLQG